MEIDQESPRLGPYKSYRILWELKDGTARFCLVKPDKSEIYGQSNLYEDENSARETLRNMVVSGQKTAYLWHTTTKGGKRALEQVLAGLLVGSDTIHAELIARVTG